MITKDRILAEIRRTAEQNGGVLGVRRFEKETGIGESQWRGKYWRTWSDAVVEAGLTPNERQHRNSDEVLILALIALTKKLGRFPGEVDINMAHSGGDDIPTAKTYRVRFGGHHARVQAVRGYVAQHKEHDDVVGLLPPEPASEKAATDIRDAAAERVDGHVYLIVSHLKAGRRYKIGYTEAVPRRHRQIALELPEKPDIVHVIETDDPAGIEAYWHNRFASKRTNGEWFALSADDVRAFKRRKFM